MPPEAAPAPTSKEVYLRLLGHVRPYWKLFVLALVAMIGMAATEPLFPALMKPLLDKGFSGRRATTSIWRRWRSSASSSCAACSATSRPMPSPGSRTG